MGQGMTGDLQRILADLRARLERVYGERLVKLVLYGSHARGEAGEGSDIDVLVVLDGPVDVTAEIARTEFDVADVCLAHNRVVACFFASQEQFEREQSPLMINVRREGVAA